MAELKEIVEKSKRAIDELEERVEGVSGELTEEAKELWGDLKKNFGAISEKLKEVVSDEKTDALKSKIDALEAKERLAAVKESAEEFTHKVAQKADAEMDIVALRAHLAKMEAEDLWEEKRKEFSREFQESTYALEKEAKEALEEVESFFSGLVKEFTGKKA